ncbi:hypothetical protein AB0M34_29845 [Nocardia sp. NPDC050193]
MIRKLIADIRDDLARILKQMSQPPAAQLRRTAEPYKEKPPQAVVDETAARTVPTATPGSSTSTNTTAVASANDSNRFLAKTETNRTEDSTRDDDHDVTRKDDNDRSDVPATANASNTPGTPEYEARLNELARDPAKNGKVSPLSLREAEIGLALERKGILKGPITRAPLDDDGNDQGEFFDGDGTRWDVKSSPDVRPSYRPKAGTPIPGAQSTSAFEAMIDKELGLQTKVILDADGMTPERLERLKAVVEANERWKGNVVWEQ